MSEDDKQAPEPSDKKADDAPAAPAPTIPLKPASGAPSAPAPAPTIPLKPASGGGAAPSAPSAPAPTVQLKAPGASSAPKTTPLKTQPLAPGADSDATQELPKATVSLGSATQALGAPTGLSAGAPSLAGVQASDEEEESDTLSNILSIVAFAAALAVLSLQLMTTSKWVDETKPVEGPGWNALIE